MQRASTKSKLGVSYMHKNMEGPYSEEQRRRAERRWKRKERRWNEDLKPKHIASGTRINVECCGNMPFLTYNNGHIVDDGVDEDYKVFLDKYLYQFDVESNSNAGVSNLDVDTVYSSDSDNDFDPQYKKFFESLRKEGNSYIASVTVNNCLDYKRYEEEEDDEDEKEITDKMEYQQSLETEGEPFHKRTDSNVSGVPKNNCNSELQFNEVDEHYQRLLDLLRTDDSNVSGVPKNNFNSALQLNEVDEDYQRLLDLLPTDDEGLMCTQVESDYNRRSSTKNSSQVSNQAFITPNEEEWASDTIKSQLNLETERGTFDRRLCSDVPKNSDNTELELDNVDEDYQKFLSYNDGDDLDIHSADEDYQRFLDSYVSNDDCLEFAKLESDLKGKNSSVRVIDGNLGHVRDRNITKTYKGIRETYKGDGSSNSSEPDLILLERDQIDANTPFVFSRIYDLSCFEDETNGRDSIHLSSNDHSEFRRRLMENLERPYDQEEYVKFLDEVNLRRKKERHAETRRGVVKSYHTHGVNKSYLELYPDLDEVIGKFKEPQKILFLLRGFFFWLQNMTRDGLFKPWTDNLCLEILRKM